MIGYYDFPECSAAFCTGQKDARPFWEGETLFRRRGRVKTQLTVVSFSDANATFDLIRLYQENGAKVQSLNYTSPPPTNGPVKKGPTEWIMDDFSAILAETGSRGQTCRRMVRRAGPAADASGDIALTVFGAWRSWAASRHFMVFSGHYLAWINRHVSGVSKNTRLVHFGGKAIFGWETVKGVSQVTVAKHTSDFPAKALWCGGLSLIDGPVLCGSTADLLKAQIGCRPVPSWSFDLARR